MTNAERMILIVDDEEQIRESVRGVLVDEGYSVRLAENGRVALDVLEQERPALVVLDVWMPEMDGIELLREMAARRPGVPVIVISGHGNIETAVRATQLGAFDFIEKPFSIESLLAIVGRALGGDVAPGHPQSEPRGPARRDGAASGAKRPARTLAKSVVVNGHGLHSGVRTGIILNPAPPRTGVVFESLSSAVEIPALVDYVDSTGYATTLHRDGASAKTVEHLLATLHAFGITDLRIKMQGEIPILDGSALEFCRLVEGGGLVERDEVEEWVVDRRFEVGDPAKGKALVLEPCDGFEIDYTLEYPTPVGREHVCYRHRGPDSFREEIAPARTFGFLRDIAALEQMGLAGGGRLNNCILIGDDGVVNGALRMESEFARHKILDIMGDFFLLGRPIRGRIVGRMTGHSDNVAMLRKIRTEAAIVGSAAER
jgi:UDP-3-O-[3-hydroxymyristoyl] N-acetylglucosamine deacetylase